MRVVLDKLSKLKQSAKTRIDLLCGQARRRYRSEGSGIDAVYSAKEKEAERFLALSPSERAQAVKDLEGSGFPFISEELGVDTHDAAALCNTWKTKGPSSSTALAKIEGKRLRAKRAIDQCTSESEVWALTELDFSDLPE